MLRTISRRAARGSRVLLCALLLSAGASAHAAPPSGPKADAKQSLAQFRAYLPTIRLGALLDNEREHGEALKRALQGYQVYLEGGLVGVYEKGQVEEALLQSHLRYLQRDREYHDALDQFASRFRLPAERRRQMEQTAISSLTNLFRRYETLSRDVEKAHNEFAEMGRAKDVAKLRPAVVKLLTTSDLVKNTGLPKRFRKLWGEWEKIDDIEKVGKKISQSKEKLNRLRRRQAELQEKHQDLPEADLRSWDDLLFEIDLGNLHFHLRTYEGQPWKVKPEEIDRQIGQNESFRVIARYFIGVADSAFTERLERLLRSWPALAPVRLGEVDLLACERDKAEQTVTSSLKTPEAQLAGRKKVRQIRALADSYRKMMKRLYELVFLQREQVFGRHRWPSSTPGADVQGLVGPVAAPPTLDKDLFKAGPLLAAEASYARAKRQLLQIWIDYQMARLGLYGDLGLPPPP